MYITSIFSFIRAKLVVLLVTFLGGVILSSCTQDESSQMPIEKEHTIKFKVNLKSNWENYNTRVKNNKSRGLAENDFSHAFGLFSGYYETENGSTQTMNYMYNEECGESMNSWQTVKNFFFPPVNMDMSFYAYYPYLDDDVLNPYIVFNGGNKLHQGIPYFDFVIPDDVSEQVDLMVATAEMKSDKIREEEPVNLHFCHLLTAVRFTIDKSVPVGYIRSISINHVADGGTYYYNGTQNWYSVNSNYKNYTLTKDIKTGTGSNISLADEDVFIMMPQFLDDEATVSLTFDNGEEINFTSSLAEKHWEAGKIVTYNIKINSLYSMSLTATIEPWEDGETFNWTTSY